MLEERKKLCPAMDLRKRMEERGLAWAMEAEEGDEKKEETPPPPEWKEDAAPRKRKHTAPGPTSTPKKTKIYSSRLQYSFSYS